MCVCGDKNSRIYKDLSLSSRSFSNIDFFLKKFIQLSKEFMEYCYITDLSSILCKFIAESRASRSSYISDCSSNRAFLAEIGN